MKIVDRVFRLGEATARIWARYWLLLCAAFFIFFSTVLKWVQFPFSRDVRGLQLPLLHDLGLLPHLSLFSFGVIGIVLFCAGLFFSRWNPLSLAVAAAFLLTLFSLVPFHIAFQQPAMLQRLAEESEVVPLIRKYTKSYLPENYGGPEAIPKRLILDSAWGRLSAAASYLYLGWYLFGLGSLLLALYSLGRLRGLRGLTLLLLVGLPVVALSIVITPILIGQHYFARGILAKAEGQDVIAIQSFRHAMRWDGWHLQDVNLYGTIGTLQKQAAIAEGSPERQISRALFLESTNQYEEAIFELENAAEAGGAIGFVAHREAARVYITYGLALYQSGAVGSAVIAWEKALAEDPGRPYSLPYLARGYFDIGSYETTVQVVEREKKLVSDHNSLLADAYSVAGDACAKLGRDEEARNYYNLSLAVDPILNYWALTGLAGE